MQTSTANCPHCRGNLCCLSAVLTKVVAFFFCGFGLIAVFNCQLASAYPPAGDAVESEQDDTPQILTLERLYHPTEKFDFDGNTPTCHWIGTKASKLLIRKGDDWQQFPLTPNSSSGESDGKNRQPWPVFGQICKHVQSLANVDAKAAVRSVARVVQSMQEETDTVLVKIGDTLATVSADAPARILTRDASSWKHVKLDPTSRRIGFTIDGDMYVTDIVTHLTRRLTDDGLDTLLDGELDWTYQEEIFGRGNYRGFWFSPDGNWLAMLRVDISDIQPYVLSSSLSERGDGSATRYSKPGDAIPHASLYVWDLRRFNSGPIPQPKLLVTSSSESEKIITGVWWHPHDGSLVYSVSDRKQTYRELHKADAAALENGLIMPRLLLREESPAWVEPPASPAWLADGGLLWRSELPAGQYRVYRINGDGSSIAPVTPSNFNVQDFQLSPDERTIWLVGDASGGVGQHRYDCLMDKPNEGLVSITGGTGWHQTEISPDGHWLIDRHSNQSIPPRLSLRSTKVRDTNSPKLNEVLIAETKLMTKTPIRIPELTTITTDDSEQLPALLIKPDFKPDSSERYPVVVEVYGGPATPIVSSRFGGRKAMYRELLARRGIGTLVVDNRSSSGTPVSATWSIRGRMGELEFRDVMSAVNWLKSQDWVDSDRIAIRGWSFGGFLTLYSMTHCDAFAAGIAGGSVTDWREYDSFYTERYMGLPSENSDGYEATSLVSAAKNLSGRLLMIHGEIDDNVHPANTLRMAKALQEANRPFQMMIYPGASHAITDPKQSWHMVQMTDQFLCDSLLGSD